MMHKFLISFLLLVVLFSCKKNDPPEGTYAKSYELRMKLNGVMWQAKPITWGRKGDIELIKKNLNLYIRAWNKSVEEDIHFHIHNFNGVGNYAIAERAFEPMFDLEYKCGDSTRFEKGYNQCSSSYKMNSSTPSYVTILSEDKLSKVIEGKFGLNLIDREGNILEVTEGYFYLPYTILEL